MADSIRSAALAAATAILVAAQCTITLNPAEKPVPSAEVPIVYMDCLAAIQSSAIPLEVVVAAKAPTYPASDLELLALGIYQEAGGDACSDDTREKVGTVILNRVADERFPDTIREVLLQRKQYGRLYWTGLEWPERASEPAERHAVQRAYRIAERLLEGHRALPADVIYQSEHIQGSEIVAYQDGFYFCR